MYIFNIELIFAGPELPQKSGNPSLIKSPNGKGLILIGDEDGAPSNKIYILKNLRWKKLTQKLQYSRSYSVAMLIPDILANCTI